VAEGEHKAAERRGFPAKRTLCKNPALAVFAPALIIVELPGGSAGTLVIGPS